MGTTKTKHFTDNQNEMAMLTKALAHPARIAIVEYLIKVDACIGGDLVNELPLAQPTVSQHLRELKNAGIIKGDVEGTKVCYCINKETMEKIQQYFIQLTQKISSNNTTCKT